ncbi:ferritin family protein [bacterium]|nr:ferritin family protein [bacterium]
MKNFTSVDDALDFAIINEQGAHDFYMHLAGKMKKPEMAKVFEEFAAEELGHKAALENVKKGGDFNTAEEYVLDLKIADYVVRVDENAEDLDYQHALILAMKREKAAYRLYTKLAAGVETEKLRKLFTSMAQEEAKHKLRFEIEYDDNYLTSKN